MKKVLLLLLLSGLLYGEQIEDRSGLTIATPSLKERQVRKLCLENQLKVLLISDPGSSQSGAALAVNVGSWDDPQPRPGMAHFVEHLLFLGTEKYPEEEGYTRYLDEHGGQRNAFTMADRTVYMFAVNNNGFGEALDRFGQFFIAPLFSPSGVDRECHAIHQEYCKDVPLDPWRVLYVKKELANKEHPFHSFCIGNLDTLAKISQDELKQWYQRHYSANLMHLVIYSPLGLDELEKQVTTVFSSVKNRDVQPEKCLHSLFTQDHLAKMVAVAPIQDLQILELTWEIPEQNPDVKADQLISHVIGHEGDSSLLAQLKREGLADGLSAGSFHAGKKQTLFNLSVYLTAKGIKEYDTVIQRCFEAIASYRTTGIPRFVFDEVIQIDTLNYTYQSREEIFQTVTEYAMTMVDEDLATFPRKSLMPTRYDSAEIDRTLNALTPEQCQFTLIANPELTRIEPERQEQWLGVDYTIKNLSKKKLRNWSTCKPHPAITIPAPNHYIPEDFVLCESATPTPQLIAQSELGKCYLQTDHEFGVPQISWTCTLKTPAITEKDAKSQVMADLYCHTVQERLNSIAYHANMGGLHYNLKPISNGVELSIEGFHDKAPLFMAEVLNQLKNLTPTRDEFNLYKELARRCYANGMTQNPFAQAKELVWNVIYKEHAGLSQKERALTTASYEDLKRFSTTVWRQCYLEGMFYGNISEAHAKELWLTLVDHFETAPYPKQKHLKQEVASLSNAHILQQKSDLPANALIVTADCGTFSFQKRAALDILAKGLEEPFFSELRTKQQTAYLVRNWSQELERHLYAFFAVQSSSHDTRDLLARFELFFENSLRHLEESVIPEKRFEAIRASLVEKLNHPAENLLSKGKLLNRLAFEYEGDFEWLDKRIEGLQSLTYAEFVEYANTFLGKTSPKRMAVCIEGNLPPQSGVHYQKATSTDKLRKLIEYQSR